MKIWERAIGCQLSAFSQRKKLRSYVPQAVSRDAEVRRSEARNTLVDYCSPREQYPIQKLLVFQPEVYVGTPRTVRIEQINVRKLRKQGTSKVLHSPRESADFEQ